MTVRVSSAARRAVYTVGEVNSRSFYVTMNGRRERFLLTQWNDWLEARTNEGDVLLDGRAMKPPAQSTLRGVSAVGSVQVNVSLRARELRFMRGFKDVLGSYEIRQVSADDEAVRYRVARQGSDYLVTLDRSWRAVPDCSCPDAQHGGRRGHAGFCKHVIAVLMTDEEHRYQLLDLFL